MMNLLTPSFQRAEEMKKKKNIPLASALPASPFEEYGKQQKKRAMFSTILGAGLGAERFGG